jgi:hypothetical protein
MATGLAVLVVLGIVHWEAVRDHVEAWHFQLKNQTVVIEPDPARRGLNVEYQYFHRLDCFFILARYRGLPVILDSRSISIFAGDRGKLLVEGSVMAADSASELAGIGWRMIDQRFPRRAIVVIRDKTVRVPRSRGGGYTIQLGLRDGRSGPFEPIFGPPLPDPAFRLPTEDRSSRRTPSFPNPKPKRTKGPRVSKPGEWPLLPLR